MRLPLLTSALVAATVAALGPALPATATTAGAAAGARSLEIPAGASSIGIRGEGHGHGHGMSQYGALGAARAGLGHRQILAHYYPGTQVGRTGGKVRVLLATATPTRVRATAKLKVQVVGGRSWKVSRQSKKVRRATQWRARGLSGKRTRIEYRTGSRWRTFRKVSGDVAFSAGKVPLRLKAGADSGTFRGRLVAARTSAGGKRRDVVNVVPVEQYLRGVVPEEMPALWKPAAVRAQAVAARSYVAFEKATTDRGHFDVYDTTRSQVYGGAGAEHRASDRAVRATAHEIRTYRSRPAFTQFTASNGGHTLANSAVPYLVSGPDRYDPVRTWSTRVDLSRFAERFGSTWPLASIEVRTHPQAGRWVESVVLTGTDGRTNTVPGSTFASWAGLPSGSFRFVP